VNDVIVVDDTDILIVEDPSQPEFIDVERDVHIITSGESGPRGAPGASGAGGIEFPFAWGDASPRTVTAATAGKLVYGVQLHVSAAFDGTGAQLQVGDAGDPERFMAAGQNDPATVATFTTAPSHRYGVDTSVLLTITPGAGATAGSGLLTLFIEQ
jgi:hypothetical protein